MRRLRPPPESYPKPAKKSGLAAAPIIYYTPETRWAWGAGGLAYFSLTKDESVPRPSNIAFSGVFTQNKQYSFDLNPDFYFRHGYHAQFDLQYAKFPDKFFGVGNDTPESLEEPYTSKYWKLRVEVLKKTVGSVNLGFQYLFDSVSMTEVEKRRGAGFRGRLRKRRGHRLGRRAFYDHRQPGQHLFPDDGQLSPVVRSWASGAPWAAISGSAGSCWTPAAISGSPRPGCSPSSRRSCSRPGSRRSGGWGCSGGKTASAAITSAVTGIITCFTFRPNTAGCRLSGGSGWRASPGWARWRTGSTGFSIDGLKYSYGLGLRFVFSRDQRINLRMDYAFGRDSSAVYFTAAEAF